MKIMKYTPGLICISIALVVMFRLMYYASFYAPSYFFWIGVILSVVGLISLIRPLTFLFIVNRTNAGRVLVGGILVSILALFCPVKLNHSPSTDQEIDGLMPNYSFNEYHEVRIKASPRKVKEIFRITGVGDIPAAQFLLKVRGIADEDVDLSDRATKNKTGSDTFTTPDFNFFIVDSSEFIAVMILKSTMLAAKQHLPAPPEISSLEQFKLFNDPGYMKVAVNFRFISTGKEETLLTTETRVKGISKNDNRTFGRYWRIIYPGSAIIRRMWLDTIKMKAEETTEL